MAVFSSKNLKLKKSEPVTKKHTVLLVDDEEANLHIMSSLLEKSCNVITATNGQIALEKIEALTEGDELSLIISDQRMPEMTGVEFLKKTVEKLPDTLRLIVSGYSDINAVLVAINEARICHFITKPFEPADFLATIKQALVTYDSNQDKQKEFSSLQEQLILCKEARQLKELQLEKAIDKLKTCGIEL